MFEFFKFNSTSKRIQYWTERVSTLIGTNAELKTKINQVRITDGQKVISDFIKNNENGLAYEHLIYMIQESGIYLSDKEIEEISRLGNKLSIKCPNLFLPTIIEIEEFYRLLNDFNQTQQKAIENLTKNWNMKLPMTRDKWINWSQDQYDKDEFKNSKGLRIFPHGFGLSYQDSEVGIDFDFGEHGEINGFDVNRLWLFIETNKIKTLFKNEKQIKKVVTYEADTGNLTFSDYLNYYKK